MRYEAAIFDLDGTLLDTLQDLAAAANEALQAHGLKVLPADNYRYLVGAGVRSLMQRSAIAAGLEPDQARHMLDPLIQRFKQAYESHWHDMTCLYPGIDRMLDRLQEAGMKLAVLSNKPDAFTRQIVKAYFPERSFLQVCGMLDSWPAKPDPALALDLCRRMGVEPARTAMIGDSGSDMETGQRAGMNALGVLWGFRDAAELTGGGAVRLFDNPSALADWLLAAGAPPQVQ